MIAVDPVTGLRAPNLDGGADGSRVTDYRRQLDLRTAMAETSYTFKGVEYKREYFASMADHIFAVRLTAIQPGQLYHSRCAYIVARSNTVSMP